MKSLEMVELNGTYCVEESTEIIKLTRTKQPTWYKKKKDGTVVPLEKIHKRSYKDIIIGMFENDLERKELSVVEEKILDGKHESPRIRLIIKKYGEKQTSIILSQKQAEEITTAIHENFSYDVEFSDESPVLELNNETKILIALLNSSDFQITVANLEKFNVGPVSFNVAVKSLIKKGVMQKCGRIGRRYIYTATCPKDELRKLFGVE